MLSVSSMRWSEPIWAVEKDAPSLAIPSRLLYQTDSRSKLDPPWKIQDGQWSIDAGTIVGGTEPEDRHGAVLRFEGDIQDFMLRFEFTLDGAQTMTLRFGSDQGHLARLTITSRGFSIQKDDKDHAGPDEAFVLARIPAKFDQGVWYQARVEMVGEEMLAVVDGKIAYGLRAEFAVVKSDPGFTCGGASLRLRNIAMSEAKRNADFALPASNAAAQSAPAKRRKK